MGQVLQACERARAHTHTPNVYANIVITYIILALRARSEYIQM